jgi:hypothetical protein
MHRITISVLAVLALCPVTSYARMPVVDIASGSVSARSAFGADGENKSVATATAVSVAPTRKVVSRRAKTRVSAPISADSGANIVASNDVLVPRRPSADLWARNDVALRMPSAGEFSVIRSDDLLPEESLDKKIAVAKPVSETESLKTEVNNHYRIYWDKPDNINDATFTLTYLTKPTPIILERVDRKAGLSIDEIDIVDDGMDWNCKLPKSLHRDILMRAVQLAKQTYVGQ